MSKDPQKERTELEHIAKIRCSQLSGYAIQLAHECAGNEWDRVAQTCVSANLALNQLAGSVSQLLPIAPNFTVGSEKK